LAYDFDKQLAQGHDGEERLDQFFGQWYRVDPVNRELQRLGIDRVFTAKRNGVVWLVEYKSDTTAARTGNAFIETVSVDIANKRGWAYTCAAHMLIYYIPPTGDIRVLSVERLKTELLGNLNQYVTHTIPNVRGGQAYNTIGVCIPLAKLDAITIYQRKLCRQQKILRQQLVV